MRELTVVGLSPDGSRLLLQAGEESFQLDLADVRRAERAAPPPPAEPSADGPPPPTPREIQLRIRRGETAAAIAEQAGLSPASVERYETPVLAERQHQADAARRAHVDGRVVDDLVRDHMARMAVDPAVVTWDAWLTDSGRWEVRATGGRVVVRLGWDAAARRVQPLDETARQALLLAPAAEDALGAVLRPTAAAQLRAAPAGPASDEDAPRRKGRATVPAWDDITSEIFGRREDAETGPAE